MERHGVLVGILNRDDFEYEKRKILNRLIELAAKRNIEVTIQWSDGKGHASERRYEIDSELAVPSNPTNNRALPEVGALSEEESIGLDDDDYAGCDWTTCREDKAIFCWPARREFPARIIICARMPGSLDNLVLDLAWDSPPILPVATSPSSADTQTVAAPRLGCVAALVTPPPRAVVREPGAGVPRGRDVAAAIREV